jgi:hypothetical protein
MCGTPAPAIEPFQALSVIPDEFGGVDHEASVSRSDSQQKPPKPWLRRLIPIITVSIGDDFICVVFPKGSRTQTAQRIRPSG